MTPNWALTIAYWLHMLATLIWIGGLTTLAVLVIPSAQRSLDNIAYASLLNDIQRRLDPLAWFSLIVLISSGLIQMSANPNYEGFLSVSNRWATAILIKHILFFVMIVVSAYLSWGLLPKMRRTAMRLAQGKEHTPESMSLQRQSNRLLRFNLLLAVLVLALTAIARAS
jgi:uncharacterized membrane protein